MMNGLIQPALIVSPLRGSNQHLHQDGPTWREQQRNQQAMLWRRDRRMTAGRASAHGMRPGFDPRRNWIRCAAASDRLLKNQFLP
jgi:hypothetical protein